ncbi:GNAT family N-acetyltransferase [uncultured Roseobacter sp.]|uniref:GNAT family N-acetyltransferase n=1 Tax=uncultured Roseobacter sp. TaxID=114847 RepID=UPI002636A025|nr:GNAT family N-acetyltransferase [uncultured Roseobacter sp.]
MFDAAPVSAPVPLQQSEAFHRALAAFGRTPERLACGTLVLHRTFGPLPVRMIVRPRAQTVFDMHRLLERLPGRGPVILSPDAPMPLGQLGALPVVSPTTVAWLDLSPGEDALMAGLHQKWRNRLRHAQRQELRISRQNLPDDPSHWLLQMDAQQQRARRYRSWPPALTRAFARANPSQAKLFTARLGGNPVSALLLLRHGEVASYHIGHTGPLGRLTSAQTLLMWQAILWARRKGMRRLELGTLDTEEGAGRARFKLGTGAVTQRLGGTWIYAPALRPLARPLARLDRALMAGT